MATWLTTSKMDPALAARVEKSVRGGRNASPVLRRLVGIARIGAVFALVFGVYTCVSGRRRDASALESRRSALLDTATARGADLTAEDRAAVARARRWIQPLAGHYEGDLVAASLRAPGALKTTLARPLLYVRGPIAAFDSESAVAESAATSRKDALVVCLLDPPPARTEKAVLEKVRVAYFGGTAFESATADVHRLHEAIVGLPYLEAAFADRIRQAPAEADLKRLAAELDKAPIDAGLKAARASLLLIALDEEGDGQGPTELDGERPHHVRVALVDLASSEVLLRARRHVDPKWISEDKRPTFAAGLDSCSLAYDLHAELASSK